MASVKPESYLHTAALAAYVANRWQQQHPAYTTTFATANNLEQLATAFKTNIMESAAQKALKKSNTLALIAVNAAIDKALSNLKTEIKYLYRHEADLSVYYQAYGLEKKPKSSDNFYCIPKNNNQRNSTLGRLVAKMGEPNDPLQSLLQQWTELRDTHTRLLEENLSLRSDKASLSRKSVAFKTQIHKLLSKLAAQIRIDFADEDRNKRLREFGFLKETFE